MFAIGDKEWAGISKLAEEAGEVLQVIGKLLGTRGKRKHWDGTDLRVRLLEEIADLAAAIEFVMGEMSPSELADVQARVRKKLGLFRLWHSTDPKVPA